MTPADIAESGEKHVEAWLSGTGYRCHASKPHHGATDIEAVGEDENMIVLVKSALVPTPVPDATTLERGRVVSRAMTLGYDAWFAKVHVDNRGDLVGEIEWAQLNH